MGCARGPRNDAARPLCCCCCAKSCAWICWICTGPRWVSPAAAFTDDGHAATGEAYDEEGGKGGSWEKEVVVGAGGGGSAVYEEAGK
uniref:Uncharacterized protein n=1 Tax=Arundo donax TaxID=35708 RepID=A0A0A9AVW6_ARUDO